MILSSLPSLSRNANMAGTPGHRNNSSTSTSRARRSAPIGFRIGRRQRDPSLEPKGKAFTSEHKRDGRLRTWRRHLDPTAIVGHRHVSTNLKAELANVEVQCLILISNGYGHPFHVHDSSVIHDRGHVILLSSRTSKKQTARRGE